MARELHGPGKVVRGYPSKDTPMTPSVGFRVTLVNGALGNLSAFGIYMSPQDVLTDDGDFSKCAVCGGKLKQETRSAVMERQLCHQGLSFRCRSTAAHLNCVFKAGDSRGAVTIAEFPRLARAGLEAKHLKSRHGNVSLSFCSCSCSLQGVKSFFQIGTAESSSRCFSGASMKSTRPQCAAGSYGGSTLSWMPGAAS